jgi:hypothetical protein
MIKHRTIIIPASVQPNARALCKGLAGIAGDGMFTTGLSATGKAPATHYISSGPISPTWPRCCRARRSRRTRTARLS